MTIYVLSAYNFSVFFLSRTYNKNKISRKKKPVKNGDNFKQSFIN